MAYTTGPAGDAGALKSALVTACKNVGWIEENDNQGKTVLSKDGIYVRVERTFDTTVTPNLDRLSLLGRIQLQPGGVEAPDNVMLGDWCSIADPYVFHYIFPVTYHIFTFTNNGVYHEVYMVIQSGVEYQWCAFGRSDQLGLPGTGNWVGATFGGRTRYGTGKLISISPQSGGHIWGGTSGALFWGTKYSSYSQWYIANNCWLHNGFETDYPWALGTGSNYTTDIIGIRYLTELVKAQVSAFSTESILLPIRAYKVRPANKVSQILEVKNARHIRVDNYLPEQIITLGTDSWMIFPYFKKNLAVRDGGESIDHTGTFGWAIKKP